MTFLAEGQRREIEALARAFRANTGRPIFVPPKLYDHMAVNNVDMRDMARLDPMPMAFRRQTTEGGNLD